MTGDDKMIYSILEHLSPRTQLALRAYRGGSWVMILAGHYLCVALAYTQVVSSYLSTVSGCGDCTATGYSLFACSQKISVRYRWAGSVAMNLAELRRRSGRFITEDAKE